MPNHPNRSKGPKGPAANPTPAEIRAATERVQQILNCGITEAQDWCAEKLFTTRRTYQQWEYDERRMHPAFFDLLKIRIGEIQ